MRTKGQPTGLKVLDELVSEGVAQFTSAEVAARLGRSPAATDTPRSTCSGWAARSRPSWTLCNPATRRARHDRRCGGECPFLRRRRVPRRPTSRRVPNRIGSTRSSVHPSRSIQIALVKRTRSDALSGRRLTVVQEPETALEVGARKQDGVYISDLERSLLDAAARPELVGGVAILAEALGADSFQGSRCGTAHELRPPAVMGACASQDRFPRRYIGYRWFGRAAGTSDHAAQRHRSRARPRGVVIPRREMVGSLGSLAVRASERRAPMTSKGQITRLRSRRRGRCEGRRARLCARPHRRAHLGTRRRSHARVQGRNISEAPAF